MRDYAVATGTGNGQGGVRHPKKSGSVLIQRTQIENAFIDSHQRSYRMRRMCAVLGVSASGYYGWKRRPISQRKGQDAGLLTKIKRIHRDSLESYGALQVWRALREESIVCDEHRVARLRRQDGIETRWRKQFNITTHRHTRWVAPNLLNRNFSVGRPNTARVGDFTFIPARGGWLYLAVLLDL